MSIRPIVDELEDGTATFHFIQGPCKAYPPDGFKDFFGPPPYFRFIEPDDATEKTADDDILTRIRDFPDCETPEETMRELLFGGVASSHNSIDAALRYLVNIMEESGPFDAVIGYSEGATVAATLLLHEQRRFESKGIKPMFKYAMFFGGWPPVDPDTHGMILSDMSDVRIEIPTCHISKSAGLCTFPLSHIVFFIFYFFISVLTSSSLPPPQLPVPHLLTSIDSRLPRSIPPRFASPLQRVQSGDGLPL